MALLKRKEYKGFILVSDSLLGIEEGDLTNNLHSIEENFDQFGIYGFDECIGFY